MIRHVVMWRLKSISGDARKEALEQIRAALEAQRERIPGLLRVEVGLNSSASRHAADFSLICDFADAASLGEYHKHPAHFATRAIVDPLVDHHWIVDYEV